MIEILGKLHPALVHMPIGFILIAILFEWYKKTESIFLWFMAAFSTLIAMGTGFILLKTGHYEGLNMFLHMIMGVVTAVICSLIFLSRWKDKRYFAGQNKILKFALIIVLLVGGHMGGELTHGEEYLPIKSAEKMDLDLSDQEEVVLYNDIIQPIFKAKCNRCHEDLDARGKLNMQTQEGLLSDKYGDPAVKPGDLENSEIFKRISLSPWHKKYMPPSGPDLTYSEKRIIEWWIMSGASFDENIKATSPPEDIKALLLSEYGIDFTQKSFYEKMEVPAMDQSIIDDINGKGFNINPLASNTNFVDINIKGQSSEITPDRLQSLLQGKEQITWLDLSDSDFGDQHSDILSSLSNVTKLKLQNTEITDATLDNISNLKELTVLNLYGTKITDQSIDKILSFNKLEKLYVWQTAISEEGLQRLNEGNSNLEIVGSTNL